MSLTLQMIKNTFIKISKSINRTPVLTCSTLDNMTGAKLFFKCENFQKTGVFKFRGACNAVFSLTATEAKQGVATHSSGNHAAAIALAAKQCNIPAYIVMPNNAPAVKKAAVENYGGNITFCEPTLTARETTLAEIVEATGAKFIHPFNDERVIAGQATIGKEILEQCPPLDMVVAPVGGGGLLSGIAFSMTALSPRIKVIAAEPAMADDAYQSFKTGKLVTSVNPQTICDGLLTSLGDLTFPIIQQRVNNILTASEESIIKALRLIWERMKIIVEPSAAVPLAVILENPEIFKGKKVAIVLSGGNVDIPFLTSLMYGEGEKEPEVKKEKSRKKKPV